MAEIEKTYLRQVILGGYKSINDVSIELNSQLNIVIGKNAAGKTNFLNFLQVAINNKYDKLINFHINLELIKEETVFEIDIKREVKESFSEGDFFSKEGLEKTVTIKENNKDLQIIRGNNIDVSNILMENKIYFSGILVCHGLPTYFPIVDTPMSILYGDDGFSNEIIDLLFKDDISFFTKNILYSFLSLKGSNNEPFIGSIDKIKIEEFIRSSTDPLLKSISDCLAIYSPIEEVRLSTNYNVYFNENTNELTVNNIFLEFKLDDVWHPFSNLSDGTKRLFYIISEVATSNRLHITENSIRYRPKEGDQILLIEEPELGIHPHQFHKLMSFLKEQSSNKQIVISTHSPQALDVLDKSEIDSIIIAANNRRRGTSMRHLSEMEKDKAGKYMIDMYLSDYWRFSNLEI